MRNSIRIIPTLAFAFHLCGAIPVTAQPFNVPGKTYGPTEYYIGTPVFHWYTAATGQLGGPWPPLEGRVNWTGEVEFWQRQIKDIMDANIDVMFIHLIDSFEQQRINLFTALSLLRSQGYDVPHVAPFLDPMIIWAAAPVDVSTPTGKDEFVSHYIRWFNQYYAQNPDAQADSYVFRIGGRTVLNTWHCNPNVVTDIGNLSRNDVESRLAAALGANHPNFNNGIYMIGTTGGVPPNFCDERLHQFSNTAYVSTALFNNKKMGTMKAGYWDQNVRTPGIFLARDGGVPYVDGWVTLNNIRKGGINVDGPGLAPHIYHTQVESWNEYDEGTGIYSGDPGPPYIAPNNQSGNNDVWSATNNPREYIDTTAAGASEYNDLPQRDAKFLSHTVPSLVSPGQVISGLITVRNDGNAEWSNAGGFKLALLGPMPPKWTFDDDADGWTLVKNAFGTSGNTTYENGDWSAASGHSGGGLHIRIGGIDSTLYANGASAAWSRTIHVDNTKNIAIQFKWRLFAPMGLGGTEYGEARFEVDDQAYGLDGENYLFQFKGAAGGDQDTGWRNFSRVVTLTGPADHTIEIGGFQNLKDAPGKFIDVYIDEVAIVGVDAAPPFSPTRFTINDSQDEIPTYSGIFRGRAKTFNVQLNAPLAPGVYALNFQMLQEPSIFFGDRLEIQVQVPPAIEAHSPNPANGAIDLHPAVILQWTSGTGTLSHNIYFGTDPINVEGATTSSPEFRGNHPAGTTTFDPPGLLTQLNTYYWRIDEVQPTGLPVRGRLWTFSTFSIPGDMNKDGDVDIEDFGTFQICFSGPDIAFATGCRSADLTADGDVDPGDFAIFTKCLTGANVLVTPDCAD